MGVGRSSNTAMWARRALTAGLILLAAGHVWQLVVSLSS